MYVDESMKEWVDRERHESNQMLLRRGKIFEAAAKECGLEMVPFDAGFFASIPCKDPDEVAALLFPKGLFIVPLARGLRVAISAINEEQCKFIPKMIKDALDEYYGK